VIEKYGHEDKESFQDGVKVEGKEEAGWFYILIYNTHLVNFLASRD
jgi:hypothetical protein